MVNVGTGGKGTRFIATDYPNEDGLEAGTQKQTGHEMALIPESSNIPEREKEGFS